MNFSDIAFSFNRALSLTLSRKKLLLVFIVLLLCGILTVFFRALAIHASQWVLMSLGFLPFFLCSGFLLSLGVLLVRIYHDEIKQRPKRYRDILARSWETAVGSSYFSIPLLFCYLILWLLLGLFILLKEIPGIGDFFAVFLSFGPFLINLASIILGLLSISMLFFIAPVIALKGLQRVKVTQIVMRRLREDMFSNVVLALLATLPLLFSLFFLFLAVYLTGSVCYACSDPMHRVLQWFIMMIPFAALLSPAVIFFFNFAAEAHVLLQRNLRIE